MILKPLRVSVLPFLPGMVIAAVWLVMSTQVALAAGVVGDGTPASCTDAAINGAFSSGNGPISFDCGTAPVTITVNTRVVGSGESFVVDGNNKIVLDGEDLRQLFIVSGGGTLTLRNITLIRGGSFDGSVVRNSLNGDLTLRNVLVKDSGAEANRGGAIYNEGLLEVELSTFNSNHARQYGGAIFNAAGAIASVRTSFLVGNRASDPIAAPGDGGAIYNMGTLSIEASTFFANRAKRNGGGLYTQTGATDIVNSTFAENTAGTIGAGGGIYAGASTGTELVNVTVERNNGDTAGGIWNGGNVSIVNTIIASSSTTADNGTPSLNCDGPSVNSGGHNLIGDNSCVTGGDPTDKRNISPMLSFINDNGGPTPTLLPLTGSPVIDAADNVACPTRDQRGVLRPVGSACDIGAVEFRLIDNGNGVYLPITHK